MVHVSTPLVVTPFLERKEGIRLESQSKDWRERCRLLGRKPAVEATLKFTSDCKADSFRARRRAVAYWYGTGTYGWIAVSVAK